MSDDEILAVMNVPGWDREIDLGGDMKLHHYSDRGEDTHEWNFVHRCDRGKRGVIIASIPLKKGGHHVIQEEPLTISPSIACNDCSVHGFVRNDRWVPA